MHIFQSITLFFGRVFMSLIFLLSALHKVFYWKTAQTALTNALQNWSHFAGATSYLGWLAELVAPFAFLLIMLAVIMELAGALLLILGIRIRLGAFLLIVFLVPTTLVFHHFWWFTGLKQEIELVMFLKNSAILGGLFQILAYDSTFGAEPHKPATASPTD